MFPHGRLLSQTNRTIARRNAVCRAPFRAPFLPSPLAGEGAERAQASEAGEGRCAKCRRVLNPSPGSISLRSISPPSPARGEGNRKSFSRRASARVVSTPFPVSSLRGAKRRSNPGHTENPTSHIARRNRRTGWLRYTRHDEEREAERRQAHGSSADLASGGASSGMRSPVGVPPRLSPGGLLIPKAQSRAMLPGTRSERSVRYGRPNRGAETSRCSTGVSRAAPVPVQRSTSRAGHSAGRMMPEPPGSQGDEPRPAGTALAPSVGVTGDVP